ncbi:OmpW/AlkL family protein [Oceanobacter mangrovi]|uniref:OmpW/AlkL family protein n=1 Tax=Oceanobacter mangrovi TaxID=2862510 RepID=UPI001C8DAA07|nr:OmpW family outer membrane protein [Oceanobacter mangrovi]
MKLVQTLLATAVVVSAVPAMAYEAGDVIVKVGAVNVSPQSSSYDDGATKIEVEDDTQLGLVLNYFVTPKVAVEVLAATPFEHDIKVNGNKAATTKHLPPTVSFQYYPGDVNSDWQPFIGLGVNHTFFFDEDGAAEHLSSSWGAAYSLGMNYNMSENWLANVTVWKMDIDTELNDTDITVEIDPVVVFVGAGYKF